MLRVTRHLATQLQMQNVPVNVHLNNTTNQSPSAHAPTLAPSPFNPLVSLPIARCLSARIKRVNLDFAVTSASYLQNNKVMRLRRGLSLHHRR